MKEKEKLKKNQNYSVLIYKKKKNKIKNMRRILKTLKMSYQGLMNKQKKKMKK